MTQTPLVSVVIPAFNDARFIGGALDAVFAQTYRHFEVLVVDDGSTDATAEIARSYGSQVRVITQPNSGSAVARNRGMSEARGDYLAFLDADDYWLPNKLSQQIAYLERNPDTAFVTCAWKYWHWPSVANPMDVARDSPSTSADLELDTEASGWLYPVLLLDCTIQTSTVVLRRELVARVGTFDVSLRRGQDYDYWLRCSQITPIHQLRALGALYRLREDSITKRVHDVNYGGIMLEGAVARFGMRPPIGAVAAAPVSRFKVRGRIGRVWRDFAIGHAELGHRRQALAAARRALRWSPWDPIAWRCLLRYALMRERSPDGKA